MPNSTATPAWPAPAAPAATPSPTTTTAPTATVTATKKSHHNGKKTYPVTPDMSTHPFYAFVDKIGRDNIALCTFLADPNGYPDAANLTADQKAALLSGKWKPIQAQVAAENDRLGTIVNDYLPVQIGWNMKSVATKIRVLAPANP